MYRVGFPGWRLAGRLGVTLLIRVHVHYDPEVKIYWTTSPDLRGLVVTGNSLDELFKETQAGIDSLLELEIKDTRGVHAAPRLTFTPDALGAA
jgi:predicted RNase H-like HicB family nuclease